MSPLWNILLLHSSMVFFLFVFFLWDCSCDSNDKWECPACFVAVLLWIILMMSSCSTYTLIWRFVGATSWSISLLISGNFDLLISFIFFVLLWLCFPFKAVFNTHLVWNPPVYILCLHCNLFSFPHRLFCFTKKGTVSNNLLFAFPKRYL